MSFIWLFIGITTFMFLVVEFFNFAIYRFFFGDKAPTWNGILPILFLVGSFVVYDALGYAYGTKIANLILFSCLFGRFLYLTIKGPTK
jgi:hypothetical protein